MVEFGDRLRQLRKERNLTQQQLAELIGVKNSVISFYEVGERMPSPEVLRKLAMALHVSTDYLLGIERTAMWDATGLDEQDCLVVQTLISHLREKNCR
ncbi:MAG: helix-turn-helix domain-containing protein [Aristaeellaceae bacterium]